MLCRGSRQSGRCRRPGRPHDRALRDDADVQFYLGKSYQQLKRWDECRPALERALALQGRGPYVVQAAIAALHADEPRDWPQIAVLYGELARLTGSPVVELNRAVAVGEAEGPEHGLAIADRLDLDGYRYFHSARADFLRRWRQAM